MREERITYYGREDKCYPRRLRSLPRMPEGLYVRGSLPEEGRPSAAIVGARMCSAYGKQEAYDFAKVLALHGVDIISGLAYGIDASAHEGALAGGGKTHCVLGCGVDICYPRENYPLYREILKSGGGVLSEFPPKSAPAAWHFPIRNRIISGLADVVLVVEAREKSGSLITADYALEQGKAVFALPGRVSDALSRGCNYLIYQGAGIAFDPGCILEELGIEYGRTSGAKEKCKKVFDGDEENVYRHLEILPKSIGNLVAETELPVQKLARILVLLQSMGYAVEEPRNYWRKRPD